MFKHHDEGFSIVELLVVVGLIAVLVAVTGTQLLAYNLQGVNAAASTDIRNAAAAEKMFFANWGVYASSNMGGYPGVGSVFTSFGSNNTGLIWASSISPTAPISTIPSPGFQIGVSQGVGVVINTSSMGVSYTLGGKHAAGDRCFAMDSDTREVYWVNGPAGAAMLSMGIPVPTAGFNDIDGVGGMFPCLGVAPASIMWTAL